MKQTNKKQQEQPGMEDSESTVAPTHYLKLTVFNNRENHNVQRNRKVWPQNKKQKQSIETFSDGAQILDLVDEAFKTAIISMFKELKGSIKRLKEGVTLLTSQI